MAVSLRRLLAQRTGDDCLTLAQLRLVCEQGTQLGIMSPRDALAIANERQHALVEVSAAATPPVWRLRLAASLASAPDASADGAVADGRRGGSGGDKPERSSKKKAAKPSKEPKMKEVRLMDKCEPRDAQTKIATVRKFLAKGHVVRVFALNTGRVHADSGKAMAQVLVEDVCAACTEDATNTGIGGQTATATTTGKNILGVVASTLTPKGGGGRGPPTPRRSEKRTRASSERRTHEPESTRDRRLY